MCINTLIGGLTLWVVAWSAPLYRLSEKLAELIVFPFRLLLSLALELFLLSLILPYGLVTVGLLNFIAEAVQAGQAGLVIAGVTSLLTQLIVWVSSIALFFRKPWGWYGLGIGAILLILNELLAGSLVPPARILSVMLVMGVVVAGWYWSKGSCCSGCRLKQSQRLLQSNKKMEC